MNLDNYNAKHLCRCCGQRAEIHRSSDGACPPPKPFPKFPERVEQRRGMPAAQAEFQRRLDSYWAKSPGFFIPR